MDTAEGNITTIQSNVSTITTQLNKVSTWQLLVSQKIDNVTDNWIRIFYNVASGEVVMMVQCNAALSSGFHYGAAISSTLRPYAKYGTLASWYTNVLWPTTSNNQGRNAGINASGQPFLWAGTAGGTRQSGGSLTWFVEAGQSFTPIETIGSTISLSRAFSAAMLMGDRELRGDTYVMENADAYAAAADIIGI